MILLSLVVSLATLESENTLVTGETHEAFKEMKNTLANWDA